MTTATIDTTHTNEQVPTASNTPARRALHYKLNVRRLRVQRPYNEDDLRYLVARAALHDRVAPGKPLRTQVHDVHRQWLALLKALHTAHAPADPPAWLLAMADCTPHLAHTVFQKPTKTATGRTVYTTEPRQGQTCGYRICPYCHGRRCSALVEEVLAGGASVPLSLIQTQIDVPGLTPATLKPELNRIKRTLRRRLDRQPERRGRPVWLHVWAKPSVLDPASSNYVQIQVLVADTGPALRPCDGEGRLAGHPVHEPQYEQGLVRNVLPKFTPYLTPVFSQPQRAAALVPPWLSALRGYQPIARIAPTP